MFVEIPSLMVPETSTRRRVFEEDCSIKDKELIKWSSFTDSALLLDEIVPPMPRKPVLLIADSMGRCIENTDKDIAPIIRDDYSFDTIAADIVNDVINVRYNNIIIWAGAHNIHHMDMSMVLDHLKALVNIIRARNVKANICISSLIPKPRENHLTQPLFIQFNRIIKRMVMAAMDGRIFFLQSHRVFLDCDYDIIRPIIDNYQDGFHLNCNGAKQLREYWGEQLKLIA